jgi:PKD repeat protein
MKTLLYSVYRFFPLAFIFICFFFSGFANNVSDTNGLPGFIENKGQVTDVHGVSQPQLLYKCSLPFNDVYLEKNALHYVVRNPKAKPSQDLEDETTENIHHVFVELIGANPEVVVKPSGRRLNYTNYYLGRNIKLSRVPTFNEVTYQNIYPNIDWKVYTKLDENGIPVLKYDFVVHSGGDPSIIQLKYNGVYSQEIDKHGNLRSQLEFGPLIDQAPYVYSLGTKEQIDCSYLLEKESIGFDLLGYDSNSAIVIDPTVSWSTYIGAEDQDEANEVTIDRSSHSIVTGQAGSASFPTLNGFQMIGFGVNAFVSKLDSSGSLIWSTFLGGTNAEKGHAITSDTLNNIIITGYTKSSDFPVHQAIDSTYNGTTNDFDAFVSKFNSTGQLMWSTYLGGGKDENDATEYSDAGICVDNNNNIYVTGTTESNDFPTLNSYQDTISGNASMPDVFVTKISDSGVMIWSRYVGGSLHDYAHDITWVNDKLYVCGRSRFLDFPILNSSMPIGPYENFFAMQMNPLDGAVVRSGSIGGSSDVYGCDMAVNKDGIIAICGATNSTDFPTFNALQPTHPNGSGFTGAFVILDTNFALISSSYLGSTSTSGTLIGCTTFNNDFILTGVSGLGFPILNPIQATVTGGGDFVIVKMSDSAQIIWSTFYGGSAAEQHQRLFKSATDCLGNIVFVGTTQSTDYPALNAFQPTYGGLYDGTITSIKDTVNICSTGNTTWTYSSSGATVQFDATSIGGNTIWWDFGDGLYGTDSSIIHQYTSTGTYEVCLYISNDTCCNFICQQVDVCVPPIAAFAWVDSLNVVNFQNLSQNADSVFWDFGDGNTSSQFNPSHTYSLFGFYSVCMIVYSSCGTDTSCKGVTITPTTIEENNKIQNAITVYPNPNDGNFIIDLSREYDNVDIIIHNVVGQTVLYQNFGTSRKISFDLMGADGLYFMTVNTIEGQLITLKILKE